MSMSYNKIEFKPFDTLTAEHMNALQDAVINHEKNIADFNQHTHDFSEIGNGIVPISNGGTGATSVDEAVANLGVTRIQIVSYVGTGTCGQDNPCSVTADFPIKAVEAVTYKNREGRFDGYPRGTYEEVYLITSELTTEWTTKVSLGHMDADGGKFGSKKSADGKTVSWYGTQANFQLNLEGYTYFFILYG